MVVAVLGGLCRACMGSSDTILYISIIASKSRCAEAKRSIHRLLFLVSIHHATFISHTHTHSHTHTAQASINRQRSWQATQLQPLGLARSYTFPTQSVTLHTSLGDIKVRPGPHKVPIRSPH